MTSPQTPADRPKLLSFQPLSPRGPICPFSSHRGKGQTSDHLKLVTSCHKYHNFRKVRVTRESKTTIKGHSILFHLYCGETAKLYAKFKLSPLGEYAVIQDKPNVHLSDKKFLAALLNANKLCDYSLRLNEQYGEEVMAMQFSPQYDDDGNQIPRSLQVHFFQREQQPDLPNKLMNLKPNLENGEYHINLGDDPVIKSIKNCVLANSHKEPMVYIRKVKDDVLEIEGIEEIDDLRLFAIGIASFLCK